MQSALKNKLYNKYKDVVDFKLLYSREVHADEPTDMAGKTARACDMSKLVEIPVLMDDLESSVFRKYGGPPPNMSFLIGAEGKILARVYNIYMSWRLDRAIKKYAVR